MACCDCSSLSRRPVFSNMDLRYVKEADPARQALLEIYASVVLRKKVNDFDTH
jgi:hypothetical protein